MFANARLTAHGNGTYNGNSPHRLTIKENYSSSFGAFAFMAWTPVLFEAQYDCIIRGIIPIRVSAQQDADHLYFGMRKED